MGNEPIDYCEVLPYNHEEFHINADVYDSRLSKFYICCFARKREHVFPSRVPIQAAYDPGKKLPSRLKCW